jgi:cytochrome c-type biogenesis protein
VLEAPLGLAFAAGLVATLNPCGFAMLPAYLSYFLGLSGDEGEGRRADAAVVRALTVGGVVSLGFLVVFVIAGLLITAGLRAVIDLIPWLALLVGVGLVVLAVAMLRGYQPQVGLPKLEAGTGSRRYRSVFVFGISYAIASLSCTLPVFLTVVVGSITGASFVSALSVFVAYGLGMSMVLLVLTLALAVAKQGVVHRLRWFMRHVNRISAALLLTAGLYITFFWAFNITRDPTQQTSLDRWVETLSQRATDLVGENRAIVGIILGGILFAVLAWLLLREPQDQSRDRAVRDSVGQ